VIDATHQLDADALDNVESAMHVREVFLRPYCERDAAALATWASSPDELLQWAGTIFTFPLDERQLLAYAAGADEHRRLFSALGVSDRRVLGYAELKILPEDSLGKIGRVAVAPQARGQRVATQMLSWLTALAFQELGLGRLELLVFSFNTPAIACYRRAGFTEHAIRRNARKGSDGYWDAIHMELTHDSYRSRSIAPTHV
jgi:RimJ/RimL family protein N-acetyltransferase